MVDLRDHVLTKLGASGFYLDEDGQDIIVSARGTPAETQHARIRVLQTSAKVVSGKGMWARKKYLAFLQGNVTSWVEAWKAEQVG